MRKVYSLDQIKVAIDFATGDDGRTSEEAIEVLKNEFKHTSVSSKLLGKNLFLDADNSIQRVL